VVAHQRPPARPLARLGSRTAPPADCADCVDLCEAKELFDGLRPADLNDAVTGWAPWEACGAV